MKDVKEEENNIEEVDKKSESTSEAEESSGENKVLDYLKELLNVVNVNDAIDSFNNVNLEKVKSQELTNLEKLKSDDLGKRLNLKFWSNKFKKEFFVVLIILIAICYLSYVNKIEDSTVGTLLGSIIGYAVGNFSSSNKNH